MERDPFFVPSGFEEPIVLNDGPARLHQGNTHVEGVGQLRFEWRRSPGVVWDFASDEVPYGAGGHADSEVQRLEPLAVPRHLRPPPDVALWTRERRQGLRYSADDHQPGDAVVGRSDGFSFVEVMVLNYVSQVWKERPTLDVEAHGWHFTV